MIISHLKPEYLTFKTEKFQNLSVLIHPRKGADMAPEYLHELAKAQTKEEKDLS